MSRAITANGTHEEPPSCRENARRNYRLGVLNGACVRVGFTFLHPSLVLAAYVYELTGSNTLVGILVALNAAGMMWPQLLVSSRIEHLPRKLPVYVRITVARMILLLIIAGSIWLSGIYPNRWTLGLFFVSYFLYSSANGSGFMPFFDIVGRTVASERLGGFFAWRSLFGESLGFLSGFLIVQPLLHRIPFPTSYALMVLLALVASSIGWLAFFFVVEEPNHRRPRPSGLIETIRRAGRAARKDRNYRGILILRLLLRVSGLAVAFYVPYGVERLGAVGLAGVFIGTMSLSQLPSSLIWGRISERYGNRACLIGGSVFFILSPVAALIAPHLPDIGEWTMPGLEVAFDLPLVVYLLALAFFGLGIASQMIAGNAFLIDISPPDRRPSRIAFMNTVSFPLTLLPAVVGTLIGANVLNLEALFTAVAVAGLLMLLVAIGLEDPREQPT